TTGPDIAPDAPYRVVNIGSSNPIGLEDFISTIEQILGRQAIRRDLPTQPGDVPATWASTVKLEHLTGFKPTTALAQGVRDFVDWYRDYYRD
ncbi:MAG TPA: UDP-glucuronate 5-epimerase, partial [Xanthobacteraceae bacterium]|nr:UDP-glucuronate 5-epimerase [Xanthobacteraceae bacterium]